MKKPKKFNRIMWMVEDLAHGNFPLLRENAEWGLFKALEDHKEHDCKRPVGICYRIFKVRVKEL